MLTLSSDVTIQKRHWKPLSVHLWAHCKKLSRWYEWRVQGGPHHRGNFLYSFRRVVWVLLRPLRLYQWKKSEGNKANGLTSPPNAIIILTHNPAWSYQLFKDPSCWSGRGLNRRPPARPTGVLPAELIGRWIILYSVTIIIYNLSRAAIKAFSQGKWPLIYPTNPPIFMFESFSTLE